MQMVQIYRSLSFLETHIYAEKASLLLLLSQLATQNHINWEYWYFDAVRATPEIHPLSDAVSVH